MEELHINNKTSNIIWVSFKIGKWGTDVLQALYNIFVLKGLASRPVENILDVALVISKTVISLIAYVVTSTAVTTVVTAGTCLCFGSELILSLFDSFTHAALIIQDIIVYFNGKNIINDIIILKKDSLLTIPKTHIILKIDHIHINILHNDRKNKLENT